MYNNNLTLHTNKLYVEILGTNIEQNLLNRMSINLLESRLKVLCFHEENLYKLQSTFEQTKHPSSYKLQLLLDEISNCLVNMKSTTEQVLKNKRNQENENKWKNSKQIDSSYDGYRSSSYEDPIKLSESKSENVNDYKYVYQLSASSSNESLIGYEKLVSKINMQDENDDNSDNESANSSHIPYDYLHDDGDENHESSKVLVDNPTSSHTSKVSQVNCVNFDDLFNEGNLFYIYDEWRNWFDFNPDLDERFGLDFYNDKAFKNLEKPQKDDDFHISLYKIFSDKNPWNKDEKLTQIENLQINTKQDLLMLVECVYYKWIFTRNVHDHLFDVCNELFDELAVIEENSSLVHITFGQLLSSKCRSLFFISDNLDAQSLTFFRNAKFISNLCKTKILDPRIIIVCLYFLCKSKKQICLEAFLQMVTTWYGIYELKTLSESSSNARNAIDFIFDQLEQFILDIEKQQKKEFDQEKNLSKKESSPFKPDVSKITFGRLKETLNAYDLVFRTT